MPESNEQSKPALAGVASADLLACPFCGGEMKEEWEPLEFENGPIHFVNCQRCGAQGPLADDEETAKKRGNWRGEHPLEEFSL